MTEPRKWSLILTGPNNGCISKEGDAWAHSPDHFERVAIMEIPKGGFIPAPEAATAPMAVPAPAANESAKPIVNEPVDQLARSLGLVYDEAIPHNAGWFVPGYQIGYASAADAIRGMFALVKSNALSRAAIADIPDHEQPSFTF